MKDGREGAEETSHYLNGERLCFTYHSMLLIRIFGPLLHSMYAIFLFVFSFVCMPNNGAQIFYRRVGKHIGTSPAASSANDRKENGHEWRVEMVQEGKGGMGASRLRKVRQTVTEHCPFEIYEDGNFLVILLGRESA